MSRSWEDRVKEYVGPPALRMRMRSDQTITCRIDGNYGEYATSLNLGQDQEGTCTCPAEDRPCKHIEALRRTYHANADSFIDLDAQLNTLRRRTKSEILEIVRRMALRSPDALAVLSGDEEGEIEEFDLPEAREP